MDALRSRWVLGGTSRGRRPDGLFVEEIGSDAVKPYFLTEKAWTASALQQAEVLPRYRFALQGIFGLRPEERPSAIQRMDPSISRGDLPRDSVPNLLSGAGDLDEVLREVTGKWKEDLAPGDPAGVGVGGAVAVGGPAGLVGAAVRRVDDGCDGDAVRRRDRGAASGCRVGSTWWSGTRAVRAARGRPQDGGGSRIRGRRWWGRGGACSRRCMRSRPESNCWRRSKSRRPTYATIAQNYRRSMFR